MMAALRFLMLLALTVWVGGIVFFGAVLAPTVFSVLPKRELAGAVVTRSLAVLHWMGIAAGVLFLAASLAHNYLKSGNAAPLATRHLLVVAMLVLTLVSQLGVAAKMQPLRADMVEIDSVPHDDPRRVEFNRLHAWSTRLEGGVLLLGLAVLLLTARHL